MKLRLTSFKKGAKKKIQLALTFETRTLVMNPRLIS
jgi:hypothetical protein